MSQTTTGTSTIVLEGASGATWEFNVYSKNGAWNHVPCVYAVLKIPTSGKPTVLYVGETKDIADRFANHENEPCFRRNGWTHVCARKEPNADRRLQMEADLVKNYNPVCND